LVGGSSDAAFCWLSELQQLVISLLRRVL